MQYYLSVKQALLAKFNQLARKEQYYLLGLALLLVPYLFYVLLLNPITVSNQQLQIANQIAKEKLQTVTSLATQYQQLTEKGAGNTADVNLPRLIDRSLLRHKLTLKRMQPSSSGEIQLRFENVSFNHLVAWLYELESEYSVIVKDASISPANDVGLVSSSIRLRKG